MSRDAHIQIHTHPHMHPVYRSVCVCVSVCRIARRLCVGERERVCVCVYADHPYVCTHVSSQAELECVAQLEYECVNSQLLFENST